LGSGNSFSADRKGSCLFIHNHLAGHEIRAQSAEGSGCISFAKVADDPFDHGFLEPGIERASDAISASWFKHLAKNFFLQFGSGVPFRVTFQRQAA
jgi:hypothetical protein